MKKSGYLLLTCLLFWGCGLGHKSKEVINSAGRAIGEGSSELISGVGTGIDKTFMDSVVVSPSLYSKGLSLGKTYVSDTVFAGAYTFIAYCIYNQNFADTVLTIVYDRNGLEYGRARAFVKGNKGDASYINFIFDKRTRLEGKSRFVMK